MASARILVVMLFVALTMFTAVNARPVHAQDSEPSPATSTMPPDYRWVRFSQLPGGLVSSDVWTIVATADAIWVGTDRGVSFYDGVWHNFEPLDLGTSEPTAESVPTGTVYALTVGSDGETIYAGTEAGQIYRWDTESWSEVGDLGVPVTALLEEAGTLYAGSERGVQALAPEDALLVETLAGMNVHALEKVNGSVYAGTDGGLRRLGMEEWEEIALEQSGSASVHALSHTGGAGLVAGTPYGVLVLDEHHNVLRQVPVTDELGRSALVQALAADESGRLWAGTDGAGAYEFAAATYDTKAHGQAHDANVTIRYVRDVAVDVDGSVWFATPTGVYRYQVGMWHTDIQGDSVADPLNHINDILVASDDTLWIATGGGGVRRKPHVDGEESVQEDVVHGVAEGVPSTVLVLEEDEAGNIWAGTFYGLFQYADGGWTLPEFNKSLPATTVTTLLYRSPNLWIGTEGGLAQYYTSKQTLRSIDELNGMSIEALEVDGLGRLWVGTRTDGAWVREDDGTWTQHIHVPEDENGLPGDFIISDGLAADWREPGHMWALVSRKGLVHWDGQSWRREDADNQIPVNLLWMLESEYDPGRLWIGSEGGVTQFDGQTWGTLGQDDGLQSATAYAIARTDSGGHWIGGATGLTYYVPDDTPPWVRINTPNAGTDGTQGASIVAPYGTEIGATIDAGDLQTLQPNLYLLNRVVSAGSGDAVPEAEIDTHALAAAVETSDEPWVQGKPGAVEMPSLTAGAYELQILARDQSFNYSDIVRMPIEVYVPPPTVHVPGLGPVDPTIFAALMILGAISVLGAGYVLFEVLQQRRRSVEALNRGFNPYISGEPVRTQEMFFGRHELVQRIADTLHNNSVMIHGERRIGKTTLLYQLTTILREIEDPEYWFVPVYVDLEGTQQDHFFHLLIEEIVVGASRLPDSQKAILPQLEDLQYRTVDAEAYDDRAFHRDIHQVTDVLSSYGREHQGGKQLRLILLLDEMDVMSRYDSIIQQQLRRIFMREFASTVGAVVAGIRISKEWDRIESPWYNMFNEVELEPFTEDQALSLLIEPVAGYYKYEDDSLEFIVVRSDGRPYRVQQYGLEAVNHMLANRRRKITIEDVRKAHQRIVSTPDPRKGLEAGEPVAKKSDEDGKSGM